MNTRVFKDVGKYQHKAWLGFTTRQVIFVIPSMVITAIILGLNLFLWQFGDWFVYTVIFSFTAPMLLLGVYKPKNLYFETYIKYRLNWEMRVPVRQISTGGTHETAISKKAKGFKEYQMEA